MATVPNSDRAIIDPAKIVAYLLSGAHPIGWAKARFFKRFGFREDAPEQLVQALLTHVQSHGVANTEASTYGIKYRVDGPLATPDGRNPMVSTVWIVDTGQAIPPFVTAFPC